MAFDFDSTVPSNLTLAAALVTGVPITLSAWVNHDAITNNRFIFDCDDGVLGAFFRLIFINPNILRANTKDTATIAASADIAWTPTLGTWYHVAGRWTTVSLRNSFLNGVKSTDETSSRTPLALARTTIGTSGAGASTTAMEGKMQEYGIWNVALTDSEIASLAAGYSPRLIRPTGLTFYRDMIRDTNAPNVGAVMTANSISITPHRAMIYAC